MQTKPVFSLLLSMSVPMMLSMLIQSLYNIVDSIYVSRLGTDALTAVSLAYPLQNAILSAAVRSDDLRTVFKTFYRQPENIKRRIHIYGNRTLPFFRLSFSNCI